LEGRGYRFGEDGNVVRQRVRYDVQVAMRNRDQIGEGAVVIQDSEHRPIRTVRRQPFAARLA
jgi:hypothetical protein